MDRYVERGGRGGSEREGKQALFGVKPLNKVSIA
jgi:hypothetical protein